MQHQFLADGLRAVTTNIFTENKHIKTPLQHHLQTVRLELLKQRADVSKNVAGHPFQYQDVAIPESYLRDVDKKLAILRKDSFLDLQWLFYEELVTALEKRDSAGAWRAARKVVSPFPGPPNR